MFVWDDKNINGFRDQTVHICRGLIQRSEAFNHAIPTHILFVVEGKSLHFCNADTFPFATGDSSNKVAANLMGVSV
jgi:hypothetical protein